MTKIVKVDQNKAYMMRHIIEKNESIKNVMHAANSMTKHNNTSHPETCTPYFEASLRRHNLKKDVHSDYAILQEETT
jgi:hypothetical protein